MTTKELFAFDRTFEGTVAGIDEAGRGPLAGPVVCACCIMPSDEKLFIDGINDSKKLTEKRREALYQRIVETAVAYKVCVVDHTTIDEINILNATKRGMTEAAQELTVKPDIVLIDAVRLDLPYKTQSVIGGDAKSYAIAAASILAKVTRDRLMREYDALYPAYEFALNKGYGTAAHLRAIREHGLSPIHRRSFHVKGDGHGQ